MGSRRRQIRLVISGALFSALIGCGIASARDYYCCEHKEFPDVRTCMESPQCDDPAYQGAGYVRVPGGALENYGDCLDRCYKLFRKKSSEEVAEEWIQKISGAFVCCQQTVPNGVARSCSRRNNCIALGGVPRREGQNEIAYRSEADCNNAAHPNGQKICVDLEIPPPPPPAVSTSPVCCTHDYTLYRAAFCTTEDKCPPEVLKRDPDGNVLQWTPVLTGATCDSNLCKPIDYVCCREIISVDGTDIIASSSRKLITECQGPGTRIDRVPVFDLNNRRAYTDFFTYCESNELACCRSAANDKAEFIPAFRCDTANGYRIDPSSPTAASCTPARAPTDAM